MAFSQQTYGIVSQIGRDLLDKQPTTRRKANTVTVSIGSLITATVAIVTYLAEQGLDLPGWAPLAVAILGMVGTTLGVSKTRNGVTPSLLETLNAAIADLVDRQRGDSGAVGLPEPAAPVTTGDPAPVERDRIADTLDAIAKRIANREV